MKSPETHYTVTIYVAAPGTPLAGGGTSAAGHVYYSVSDGKKNNSYGFAPLTHGESSGPGGVSTTDVADYKDPYLEMTPVVLSVGDSNSADPAILNCIAQQFRKIR
ncbi:hypothetical protein GGR75_003873 [Xanthomonas campestris]|uniref:hypothetical protein n=1 Tax=Xanthomonas campestris TaxID=339 RepID=UPI002DF9C8C3|nr:hypothetical protein [Xanthomonas campestris]